MRQLRLQQPCVCASRLLRISAMSLGRCREFTFEGCKSKYFDWHLATFALWAGQHWHHILSGSASFNLCNPFSYGLFNLAFGRFHSGGKFDDLRFSRTHLGPRREREARCNELRRSVESSPARLQGLLGRGRAGSGFTRYRHSRELFRFLPRFSIRVWENQPSRWKRSVQVHRISGVISMSVGPSFSRATLIARSRSSRCSGLFASIPYAFANI
jgi:hypothetical protein